MLLICLANLRSLIKRVHAARVNAFFSSRSEKIIFVDVDIVVKQIEMWFIVLLTRSTCHYSFSKQLFSYCFCMLSKFAKVFEWKVWLVQVATHLHNDVVRALSSRSQCVLLSTTILVITVVKICQTHWQSMKQPFSKFVLPL